MELKQCPLQYRILPSECLSDTETQSDRDSGRVCVFVREGTLCV